MTLARWEIPANWMWVEARDIADIVGGGTPPSGDDANFASPGHGMPWIGPADLTGYKGTYISRGRRDLSTQGIANSGAVIMPKGTVLFSSRAPIGYCVIANGEVSTNQGFKSLICCAGVTPEYVRHYLRSSVDYVDSLASGTTFREVSGRKVGDVAFPLCSGREQRRIVAKLDALITRLARAREELGRAAVLSKMLRHRAAEVVFGHLNQPKVGWRYLKLRDLLTAGPSNGWSPKSDAGATGALTLKLTATTSGRLRLDDRAVKRIYEVPGEDSKYWLRDGDLLVQRANALEHVGASAIYHGPEKTYIYPDLMMRLRFDNPVLTKLVWYQLNSPTGRKYLQERATGTAGNMPKISGSVIRDFPITLPSEVEQKAVAQKLDMAFARADRLEAEATRARALLDRLEAAILAKAFRGELVPQDPKDEPASVLLDRIRAKRAAAPKPKRGRARKAVG